MKRPGASAGGTLLIGIGAWLLVAFASPAFAESRVPLESVLRALQRHGAPIVFSSEWLAPSQQVAAELGTRFDPQALRTALAPFGLDLRRVGRLWLVVRVPHAGGPHARIVDERGGAVAGAEVRTADGVAATADHTGEVALVPLLRGQSSIDVRVSAPGYLPRVASLAAAGDPSALIVLRKAPPIEEVVVTASRYAFAREDANASLDVDAADLERLPAFADDSVRRLALLPGVAGIGLSAKPRFRGGDEDEVALVFDDVELLEPFHLRDFQSPFSSLDARAVQRAQVYTGALPVRYGDHLSGALVFDSLAPGTRRYELGVSPFQTSLLASTAIDGVDALVSLRRGHLDEIVEAVNPKLGSTELYDGFVRLGAAVGEDRIEFGHLALGDRLRLHNGGDGEDAASDFRSHYTWLRHAHAWNDRLTTLTTVSLADLRNRRAGSVAAQDDTTGALYERRHARRVALDQAWRWRVDDDQQVTAGLRVQEIDASYDFRLDARYGAFGRAVQGVDARSLAFTRRPDGVRAAAYASTRWALHDVGWAFGALDDAHLELGIRVDRETDIDDGDATQVGGFAALSATPRPGTMLRVAVSRAFQPPEPSNPRASDGPESFSDVQRADQWVLGVEHDLTDDLHLQLELYGKRQPRARQRGENLFDPLVLLPELHFDRVLVDADSARAYGVELTLSGATDGFDWRAYYGHAHADERVEGRRRPRGWDQRHTAGAVLTGSRWGADFTLAAAWHSGWPTTTLATTDGGTQLVPGPEAGAHAPDYFSLDLLAQRRFRTFGLDLDVVLQLQNLTGRDNVGGVRYRLDDGELVSAKQHLPSLVPTLTLRLALPDD